MDMGGGRGGGEGGRQFLYASPSQRCVVFKSVCAYKCKVKRDINHIK